MRERGIPLIAVSAAWGGFWGSWSALLPAIKEQLGASTADLGLALSAVPVGAIPAMALAGRLAGGRERTALIAVTVAFALSVAAIAPVGSPVALGLTLLLVGMASGALDIALNLATGRAEREGGRRLFQAVHAAFPVAVIVAAPATGLARSLGMGTGAVLVTAAVIVLASSLSLLALRMGRGLPAAGGAGGRRRWRVAIVPAVLSRAAADDASGVLVSTVSAISYTGFVISPLLVAALTARVGLPGALAALGLLAVPLVVGHLGARTENCRPLRQ
ncbi:hypothetical protein [Nonomuraea aurantiaca]|uniref:hypothetical protein n=1 Tax=Nonomuraea aurantiaca TaxID=2878562 RepID=UPI001CDA194F|nr:hypothetical protein [Nonomuraea aurantiaca]MCA2219804.1 hypothetical protein [Nonomuraea aurantiaca]